MKKYLFIALAALGFAACAEKVDDTNIPKGELEESYIAINLMAADVDTRAAEDSYGYEDGTVAERAVKTAYFFFFDENGNPFNVTATENNPATAPGGGKNHLSLTIADQDPKADDLPNVSDIKEAVLILSTYKGVYPSQIVAVLNWVPTDDRYTLEDLHEELSTLGGVQDGFVMSNSVYMDGANKEVDAVPLTAANIKTTAQAATENPVNIYVERIAAKVVLTASGKVSSSDQIVVFDTEKSSSPITTLGAANDIDVYVQIHGWELYNDYNNSPLLKNIENWSIENLGLTWNDIPYYRSYWAKPRTGDIEDSFSWSYSQKDGETNTYSGFPTEYGFAVGHTTYCGENTKQGNLTKVILKGQLLQKTDGQYANLSLARWYGTEYAGNEALRTAVANSLKYTLYSSTDGQTYTAITPGDIVCVSGVPGAKSYEVGFHLSTTGEDKVWYKYSSAEGYQTMGDFANGENKLETNAYLETVEHALLYEDGQTYYYVDIEHLGTANAKYGVVRNHVYQIDIESIKGYGTPVYIGTSNIVTPPEYPIEDEASYVAAKINVLSWKVVQQGVNIVK